MANREKSLDNGVMTEPNDRYTLERFVRTQNEGETYGQVLAELRRGRKRGHWMWFIFPQIAGLGSSPMAQRFAISSLAEARAYLHHPLLGPRLRESAELALAASGTAHATAADATAVEIFGGIDSIKLRSSMTLFLRAAGPGAGNEVFERVLDRYFDGEADESTDRLLGS
jgi:uncharacterized protein (DUF1810 family)